MNYNANNKYDFIKTINRLIEDTSHESISFDEYKRFSQISSISEQSTESDQSTSNTTNLNSNYISDISELDNLLQDLYNAKKNLSKSSLNDNTSTTSRSNLISNTNNSSSSSSSSPTLSSSSQNNYLSSSNSVVYRQNFNNSPYIQNNNTSNNSFQENTKALEAEKELNMLMSSLSMYKNEKPTENLTDIPIQHESSSKKNKNLCFDCQQPIHGQVITALGYLWHPNHFVCSYCKKCIGTSIFYEKDLKPYCENDYLELFSPKCAACSKPILDKMLTALNQKWHVSCFVCYSCSKPLNDESFLEINESAYCKNCYVNELANKCKSCNGPIIENYISALNSFWHPGCFVCQECGVGFNSSSFYDYMDMPYCEIHYHQKRGSLCSGCLAPINGRCITAMNKKYHPEHFTCSFCLKQLNKGTFKEKNDKPFCHTCFQKLFPL